MRKNLLKSVKNMSYKHSIYFSIIVVVITLILDPVTVKLVSTFINDIYIPKIFSKMIQGLIILPIAYLILPKGNIEFKRKGFIYGLILSWLFILYSINNFDINYLSINGIFMPSITTIIEFVIWSLAVGFYEEVMMRGLILNNFINIWGNSKKGILRAVCISSMIFGTAHLCNLISSPTLINATLSQMFYATIIGFFFGCVYLRCKNLCSVIVLHAFFDFAWFFKSVFSTYTEIQAATDITIQSAIVVVVFFLPLVIMGLVLLRKVEPVLSKENNK